MATIIDSLLVTLGLEDSDFSAKRAKVAKGLKETGDEADKTGKKLKSSGKAGAEGFTEVAGAAAKFLAIIGGTVAIKRFIEDTVTANAALDRLAKNLNEGADSISAWSNAAELAGGTAEGLQGTMDMLSKSQTQLQLTGESGLIPFFSALGLSLADTSGRARPVSDLLLDLADKFSGMDRTTANNFGRMMGIDQGTMQLLLKGRSEVELMIARQKEYGAVTKKQAEEASRLKLAMTDGTQTLRAFGRELLSDATPALEKMFSVMSDFGAWCRENKEFIKDFLTIIAAGLAALAVAAIPINLTAIALTALAAGLAAVWQDYQVWQRGGDSLLPWDKWVPAIKRAGEWLQWLHKLASDGFYRFFAAADGVVKLFQGDSKGARFAFNEMLHGNGEGGSSATTNAGGGTPAPAARGNLPRGVRNNNPGNLNFAGQLGATKEGGPGGRFAKFGTMREGVAALVRQIGLYVSRGKNTIRKIIQTYAPAFENNTEAYIAAISKSLGISADDPLDTNNAGQIMGLVKAIAAHENGGNYVSDADLTGGFQLAKAGGIPGASRNAMGAGAGASSAGRAMVANGDSSVENHIGEIKIYTAATDADGIANDMNRAMNYTLTSQANTGLPY